MFNVSLIWGLKYAEEGIRGVMIMVCEYSISGGSGIAYFMQLHIMQLRLVVDTPQLNRHTQHNHKHTIIIL